MRRDTLILTGRQINAMIDMRRVIGIAEKTFRSHGLGRVQMPAKIYIHLDRYCGDFRAMPAYIEGLESCGIKWVNVHPRNKGHGLPSVMALIILSDPRTGFPKAIMDGTTITNLRTGAAGGIAAKYLANKNSSSVGLIGCGAQALHQLMALRELFPIKHVSVYDRNKGHARKLMKTAQRLVKGADVKNSQDIAECARAKDIVVTTTPSRKPILKASWISPGCHINAIGADARGKQELYPDLLKKAKIFVDDLTQASHSGEINVPIAKKILRRSDIKATLGEVIAGKKRGRMSRDEVTVFDSTGLAIQDVAVADYVYRTARALGFRGKITRIKFI